MIIQEAFESRTVQNDIENYTTDVTYIVSEVVGEDENSVSSFSNLNAPQFVGGLPLFGVSSVERISDKFYKVVIKYQLVTSEQPDDDTGTQITSFNFDTSGGSLHILTGFEVTEKQGDVPVDIGTALNVQEDGKVSGVDIPSPVFNFNIVQKLKSSQVTGGLVQNIYEQTGTVNRSPITIFGINFLKRDILLIGAQGAVSVKNEEGVDDIWTITYKFGAKKSLVNFKINDDIKISLKAGWDYMNILYGKIADTEIGRVIPKAYGAYVIRTFVESDFNALGAF